MTSSKSLSNPVPYTLVSTDLWMAGFLTNVCFIEKCSTTGKFKVSHSDDAALVLVDEVFEKLPSPKVKLYVSREKLDDTLKHIAKY